MSRYDINRIHRRPCWSTISTRSTFAPFVWVRRSFGATSLVELLLYGSLPTLTICGAFVSLVVPKVLGPEQFGQYSLVEALCRYGVAFDLGLSLLADRRLPVLFATASERELSEFTNTILWLRINIAAIAIGIGALLLPMLSIVGVLPFKWSLGMVALTAGVLGMLVNGPTSIERALSHRRKFAILYAAALAVLSLGRLIGILAGGVCGCFAVMGTCFGALAVYSHWGVLRPHWRSDASSVRALFAESVPLFLTIYTFTLLITANRWVVASRVDAASFGHFAFGSSVTTVLVGVVGGMTQLWYPRLAKHHAGGTTGIVSRRVLRDLAVLSGASAIASIVCVLLSPWLIGLIYAQFASSLSVIQVVLASFPATTVAAWLLPLALATGAKPWVDGVLLYLAALLFLVAATEAGVRIAGIEGAAWGLVVSMPTLVGLQLWRLCRRGVMVWRDAMMLSCVVLLATAGPALVTH